MGKQFNIGMAFIIAGAISAGLCAVVSLVMMRNWTQTIPLWVDIWCSISLALCIYGALTLVLYVIASQLQTWAFPSKKRDQNDDESER